MITVDEKVYDLAEHFLQDDKDFLSLTKEDEKKNMINHLAMAIQREIEEWFEWNRYYQMENK